jgi:hypothetical protein
MNDTQLSLPPRPANLLLAEWVLYFAKEQFGASQWSMGGPESRATMTPSQFTIGDPTALHITAKRSPDDSTWQFDISDPEQQAILQEVILRAQDQASKQELGPGVWYSTELTTVPVDISFGFHQHFARALGGQVRIVGHRRLGDRVLLEFSEATEATTGPVLFAPQASVKVDILAPGPTAGPFSNEIAGQLLETVRVICAFALGRPVNAPPTLFPSDDQHTQAAQEKRRDPAILSLARDGISLDLFGDLPSYGGLESTIKVRNALLTYDAALRQDNLDVATILYVTAMEALMPPPTEWRKERVTTRFITSIQELCAQTLDEILAHANVELAFGPIKRRQNPKRMQESLLGRIYDMRSSPVHEGLSITPRNFVQAFGADMTMRIVLLSSLTREAILAFIQAPRNSLVGHPVISPGSG